MKIKVFHLLFLISGFWYPVVSLIIVAAIFLFNIRKLVNYPHKSSKFILILLTLFSISYVFFWNDPLIPANLSYFKGKELKMLFLLPLYSAGFYILFIINGRKEIVFSSLYLFTIGMLLKALLVTYYTWLYFPYLLLQRKIMDPLTNELSNSPGYAIMAVFSLLFAVYKLKTSKTLLIKVYLLIVIVLSISIGTLLQARSFFVVLIFFLFLRYLPHLKTFKGFLYMSLILSFTFLLSNFVIDYLSSENEIFRITMENSINRFDNEGIESNRYKQWRSAISKIYNDPWGGSSTDQSIESTHWFHNFWLDVGRTSGIVPLFLIVLIEVYVIKRLICDLGFLSDDNRNFLMAFHISILMAISVEIPLEGSMVFYVFYILNISSIINLKNDFKPIPPHGFNLQYKKENIIVSPS